ncbi:MAG: N-acetylglucosamine-6-phosphate deacetylase [Pseudorhodobacter sp.]
MANRKVLRARTLYDGTGTEPLPDQAIIIEAGRIAAVLPFTDAPEMPILADAEIVTPGFIDLQINGAGGVLFNDQPDLDGLRIMAQALRKGGTAWFLPTFITDFDRRYQLAIATAQVAIDTVPGIVGLHLEGPFLSPLRPGIHPAAAIRKAEEADFGALCAADLPLMVTLAPEESGPDGIARLAQAGVLPFAGHSEASFEQVDAARIAGLRGVTHLFNAMSQMTGRAPGLVGATMALEGLFAGIIPDGHHVHPANIRNAFATLGPDRLFLVTDAMSPLGTDMTSFTLLGTEIIRDQGRLTGPGGTLAGADISMIDCVTRMTTLSGCSLTDAIRMATLTPARAMRLDGDIGTIAAGKRAGLTLLDAGLRPQAVCVDGELF